MEALFESRLLKGEERSNKKYVELVHDRFALVALKRRRSRENQEQAEAERRKEEAEAENRAAVAKAEAEREAGKIEELRKVREEAERRERELKEENRRAEEELGRRNEDLELAKERQRKVFAGFIGLLALGFVFSVGLFFLVMTEASRLRKDSEASKIALEDSKEELEKSKGALEKSLGEQIASKAELEKSKAELEKSKAELGRLESEQTSVALLVGSMQEKLRSLEGKSAESAKVLADYQRRLADFSQREEDLRKVQLESEQIAQRFKTASEELVEVKKENDLFKNRIASLEKSLLAKAPGDPIPPPVVPAPDSDRLEARRKAAIALVGDFLEAGSGDGPKKQWEFYGVEGGDFGSPGVKTRDEIEETIRTELETKTKSYWLKAPPWIVEENEAEFVLRALYASRVETPEMKDFVSRHVSESEFRIGFDRDQTPVLRSFLTRAASYNKPEDGAELHLSDVEQFDRIFRIRHDWSFNSLVNQMERDGWLALMTNELYVLAGQSYEEADLASLTDRDVVRKITDQSEFFAENLLYFTYGEISRKVASEKLVGYRVASPVRTLKFVEKPVVTYDKDKRVWMVKCKLFSHTEGELVTSVERLSTMEVRIDETRGPEIVRVEGEDVPGTRIQLPKK